ncbi:GPW/gp25 family protein [Paraburkholderia sp. BR14320]|uniref:GPW/gp25 family protein n=1 Tax=unclassified Paraburkholderia TaxID=2615204 RepID=UPI0034CD2206
MTISSNVSRNNYFDHPYRLDGRGRTAETDEDDHIRDLIHQVLFTSPGERVNRPDFGCGVAQLVFMPNSEALAAATQFLVQGALTRWLDAVIAVQKVDVLASDSTLAVTVSFTKRSTGEQLDMNFSSPWSV